MPRYTVSYTDPSFIAEERDQDHILDSALAEFAAQGSPITAGRQSVEDLLSITQMGIPLEQDHLYNPKVVDIVRQMSAFNPFFTKATADLVTLALTDYENVFNDDLDPDERKEMLEHLKMVVPKWFIHSKSEMLMLKTGIEQISHWGALSMEHVAKPDLSGIEKIVRVPPAAVRFSYDKDTDMYLPYQKVRNSLVAPAQDMRGYVKLNPNTFSYYAITLRDYGPYPIPPSFAALDTLIQKQDMYKGFAAAVTRFGILGIMTVMMQKPNQKPGESDAMYEQRLLDHLNKYRNVAQQGFSTGVVMGYQDGTQFSLQANQANTKGAQDLVRIFDNAVNAGLETYPQFMTGEGSTSEAFGRVILHMSSKHAGMYQDILNSWMSDVKSADLRLAGYNFKYYQHKHKPSLTGDEKRLEEVRQLKIQNAISLRNENVIDQDTVATELGYDSPAGPAPEKNVDKASTQNPTEAGNDGADTQVDEEGNSENAAATQFMATAQELSAFPGHPDFEVPAACEDDQDYNLSDPVANRFARKYTLAYNKIFNKVLATGIDHVERFMTDAQPVSDEKMAATMIYYQLIKSWRVDWENQSGDLATDMNDEVYRYYRADESVFPKEAFTENATFQSAPEPIFGLIDQAVVEVMSQSTNYYLSSFIVRQDTQASIFRWIEKEYIEQGAPIGKQPDQVSRFTKKFGQFVKLKGWNIERIINTTVQRMRNFGNVRYAHQAGFTQYRVVNPMDNKTCEYCKVMNGKTFSITKVNDSIKELAEGSPDQLITLFPFVTKYRIDDVKGLTTKQLEDAGMGLPPFHGNCRDRIVVVV